jgi:hypothetical protein
MKRYGLVLTAVGAALLTGLALREAGWRSHPGREHRRAVREPAADPLSTSAAWRHRQNQPRPSPSLHNLLRGGSMQSRQ